MKQLVITAAVALMLTPALASATTPTAATLTPIPEGKTLTYSDVSLWNGNQGQQAPVVIYDNTAFISTSTYYNQQNNEILDDLHGVSSGAISSITIAYFAPAGPTNATLTVYGNDAVDTGIGAVVAGPFVANGLPAGANVVTITVPGGAPVGPDMWLGVSFSGLDDGLIVADPPVIGSSHDYFFNAGTGQLLFFNGNPVANFGMAIETDVMVPVEAKTWSGIKNQLSSN